MKSMIAIFLVLALVCAASAQYYWGGVHSGAYYSPVVSSYGAWPTAHTYGTWGSPYVSYLKK